MEEVLSEPTVKVLSVERGPAPVSDPVWKTPPEMVNDPLDAMLVLLVTFSSCVGLTMLPE